MNKFKKAFTLVEMLMALLIVSIILSASLPVISQRQKAFATNYNQNKSFPIGGIIVWYDNTLPDNSWLECNGQQIPSGIEYEEARKIFGTKLPDFQGMFLRGYGSQSFTQNNGSRIGNTATTHASGTLGAIQGDSIREIYGWFDTNIIASWFVYNAPTTSSGHGAFGNVVDPSITAGYEQIVSSAGVRHSNYSSGMYDFYASRMVPVSNEIRPVNVAVKYIAKVRY